MHRVMCGSSVKTFVQVTTLFPSKKHSAEPATCRAILVFLPAVRPRAASEYSVSGAKQVNRLPRLNIRKITVIKSIAPTPPPRQCIIAQNMSASEVRSDACLVISALRSCLPPQPRSPTTFLPPTLTAFKPSPPASHARCRRRKIPP